MTRNRVVLNRHEGPPTTAPARPPFRPTKRCQEPINFWGGRAYEAFDSIWSSPRRQTGHSMVPDTFYLLKITLRPAGEHIRERGCCRRRDLRADKHVWRNAGEFAWFDWLTG